LIQTKKELELIKNQLAPTQRKLEETFEQIGQIKAELAEKNSEIMIKNEKIKSLENKVNELQAFVDKLQDEQVRTLTDLESKHTEQFQAKIDSYMKQIEELKMEKIQAIDDLKTEHLKQIEKIREEHAAEIQKLKEEHIKEKAELKDQITKLESVLLDSKLISTEKTSEAKDLSSRFKEITEKYEELIRKVEELSEEKRLLEGDIKRLNEVIDGLSTWKEQNKAKIEYFDKLSILMEQEPLFKTFLIIEEVGGINLDDLRNALGVPMVQVQKFVQKLQEIDLIEINELGKIIVKKAE
ncbi:MAG: hypothetical protein ACTSQS_17670, partial [Promethearchaeota archaeon]